MALEELVGCKGECIAYSRYGGNRVGPHSEVSLLPEELQALLFLGKWVLPSAVIARPQMKDVCGLQLDFLQASSPSQNCFPLSITTCPYSCCHSRFLVSQWHQIAQMITARIIF